MKLTRMMKALGPLAPLFCGIPVIAQQVGGGTCNSSSLNGNYSLTLSGRALNGASPELITSVLQGVGTATFDGLSKVTFTLTNNTNKTAGTPETQSGTYSIQSNCIGTLSIAEGDTATYNLGVFNSGSNYIITGEDSTYNLIASGNLMPAAACSVATFTGGYSFNGNGFGLESSVIASAFYISGVLSFDSNGNVSGGTWYATPSYGTVSNPVSVTGTYTVSSNCTATATLKDSSGNSYSLVFTITAASGAFDISAINSQVMFTGTGRPL
jgi:hypothetical protein